jgi:serine/threonine protein kinase
MAPELVSGGEVTPAADVYSLGAVLYELLTGKPPHEPATLADLAEQQRAGTITPVGELAPDVPRRLEDTVMRCLARNPAYRPGDAKALLDELDGSDGTVEAATVPLAQPEPLRSRPNRKVVLGLAAALVLAAAIAIAASLVALSGGDAQPPVVRRPAVQPVQPGVDARQQARNLGAWIRQYSR